MLAARFGGYTRNRPAEADAGPILDTYGDGPADEMDRLLDPDARRLDSPY